MKLRRPEVAMAKEGKEAGQGRLGTRGPPRTPLLRGDLRGARAELTAGVLALLQRNPCLYKQLFPPGML